jgi:hypothetical protein
MQILNRHIGGVLAFMERWGWDVGLNLITSIFIPTGSAQMMSPRASLDKTTAQRSLMPATLAANASWRATPDLWWPQLTNCFKSVAAIGSLRLIAAYYSARRELAHEIEREANEASKSLPSA